MTIRLGKDASRLVAFAMASGKNRNKVIEEAIILALGRGKKRIESGEFSHLFKEEK